MTELREYFNLKNKLFSGNKKIISLDLDNPEHKRFNDLSNKLGPKLKKINNLVDGKDYHGEEDLLLISEYRINNLNFFPSTPLHCR